MGARTQFAAPAHGQVWGRTTHDSLRRGLPLLRAAGNCRPAGAREVKVMKKITVRKSGSIKLTSSAPLYCTDCC
jgi:hypothetical protein